MAAFAGFFGFKRGDVGRRARRFVIRAVAGFFVAAGALAGATLGAVYAHDHHGAKAIVIGSAIGAGVAIGVWLTAAVLTLLVEIADSLRQLVDRGE